MINYAAIELRIAAWFLLAACETTGSKSPQSEDCGEPCLRIVAGKIVTSDRCGEVCREDRL